jgi:5,6,7,8-tetrahydromethanopterin hydro-lyase
VIFVGEAFVGDIPDNAHVNVVLGTKEQLGAAFAHALANPSKGFVPFIAVLQPNVMVKPATLFASKVAVEADHHAKLTWGPAQAGVALGVNDAVRTGVLPPEAPDNWLIIAAIWVNREARDASAVLHNNRLAIAAAITRALTNGPEAKDVEAAACMPGNPFLSRADANTMDCKA